MANATKGSLKPVLLAVIGILAVILFVQTSNLITGMAGGTLEADTSSSANNTAPVVTNVAFTMTTAVGCGEDTGGSSGYINCSADIIDNNGYSNLSTITAVIHGGSVTSTCSPNNRSNCYTGITCTPGGVINASAKTYYCVHANKLIYYSENSTWTCNVTATDGINTSSAITTQARSPFRSIEISQTIAWGAMGVGETKVVSDAVENCGNRLLDIQINASDMTCGSGTSIKSGNITAGIDIFGNTSWAMNSTLYRLQTNHPVFVGGNSPGAANKTTYWNLTIPSGISGACLGHAWFVAVENS